MSRISTYEVVPVPKLADKLIGTSVGGEIEDVTYNFTLQELLNLFIPFIPANNLQGVLDFGNTATQDINLFGTITTTNLDVTNTSNLFITYLNDEVHIVGSLFDSNNLVGTAGQVLTSTGSGVEWYTLPPIFTPNLQQVLTEGNTANLDIILTSDLSALDVSSDTATFSVDITIDGTLTDGTASVGTAGKVLSSTGIGVQWIDLPIYSATSPLFFNSITGVFSIQVANATQNGYLSSADWITFDGKQNAGNYITALTGEATATGPGSVAITLSNTAVIGKVLTGLNITGGAILATDNILQAFGKVQNQINGKQNALTLTTSGASGAATLISDTLNVPNYTLSGLGGVPLSRNLTINGIVFDLSADRSWSVGTVTSVGLSMPAAFSVASSPVTSSGTIAVTAVGLASQYIRGDGQLADFPTGGGGGGSSVSYYLNGSVNQGTFVGNTYYEMNKTPILGAGTDFNIASDGYIAQFITDANDPNSLLIPGGNWNLEFYFSASSGGGTPSFYAELYKYDGTTFTLIADNSTNPELIAFGTTVSPYFSPLAVPETVLLATDRLAIRIYVNASGRTITLHTENSNLCQVITTFTTGLQSLNGLTKQTQYLAVGTSGTDFAISSATDTHTFNLPTASATNRGALSSADWTTFNSKQNAITLTTVGTSGAATLIGSTLNIPNYADGGVLSLSAIGSSPNANAGTITGTVLNLEPASASFGGVVTTGTQTFAGEKTFFNGLKSLNTLRVDLSSTPNTTGLHSNTSGNGAALYAEADTGNAAWLYNFGTGNAVLKVEVGNLTGALATFRNTGGQVVLISNAGNITANSFIKSGGTSSQFLKADGSVDGTAYGTGSVTSVSALTLGTSGTDLSSTVANGTTTPVITLNVPTASASNRGALSSGDWTTFNSKQDTITLTTTGTSGAATFIANTLNIPQYQSVLTNPVTGTGTSNEITYWTGSSTVGSLSTATYPSLTELSYVKGVTSSIQTQLNAKQGTLTLTTVGTSGAATLVGSTLNIPNYADGGVLSLSAIGSSPNANGGTITGTVLNLEPASASFGGVVTTGSQTFAGAKTFNNGLSATASVGNTISSTNSASGGLAFYGQSTNGPGAQFDSGSMSEAGLVAKNTSTGPLQYWLNSSTIVATMSNGGNFSINGILTQTVGTSESKLTTTAGSGLEIRSDGSTAADRNIRFTLGTTEQAIINNSGNLGLGIPSPETRLHLSGDLTQQTSLNSTSQFFLILRKSRGTIASPLTVNVNDEAGGILFTGYDGATWRSGAAIRARVQAVSAGSLSSNLEFYAGNGSPSAGVHVLTMRGDTQNVLIGTTTDAGYKLDVNGTGRFSGALTGTSATFSGNGAFGGSVALTGIGGGIAVDHATTSGMQMRVGGNIKGYVYTTSTKLILEGASGVGIDMYVNSGGSPSLAIASTGAATFSSSAAEPLIISTSSSTMYTTYNSNSVLVGYIGNGNGIVSGGGATNFGIRAENILLFCAGGNNERMRITSGGNVGIGTTSVNSWGSAVGVQIKTAGAIASNSFGTTHFTWVGSNWYNDGVSDKYIAGGRGALISLVAGAVLFSTSSAVGNANDPMTLNRTFTVNANGNVLIGTTTDAGYKFQVNGQSNLDGYNYASSFQFTRAASNSVTPASGNGILVFAGGNAQMRMDTANQICFDMNNGGNPHTVLTLKQSDNTVSINSPNNGLPLELKYQNVASGYLGASGSALYAYSTNGGYVFLNASSVWVPASDAKRKRNFETYSNGLASILGLQPKLYNMDFQKDGDEKQVGLIAQEVKQFIPKAYNENGDFIGLDYNAIIVTMVNAIKEQQAQIENLKLLIK